MNAGIASRQVWFITGSQHLYGESRSGRSRRIVVRWSTH